MTTGALLRIDQLVTDHDLEDATSRGDERHLVDDVFELFQQAFRQTDGFRCVASLSAILDRDLHAPIVGGGLCLVDEPAAHL
jgi:hypothetical protein